MWAYELTAPSRLQPRSRPTPRPEDDADVIVRPLVGGICGSDIAHFRRGPGPAQRIGFPLHEIVGDVVESRTNRFSAGDRVVGWASRMDGLAELVATSEDGVIVCDTVTPPNHAVLIQPLACVINAVDRLSGLGGADVAILGLGPIGLLFAHVLRSRGVRRITGVDPIDRRQSSTDFWIDEFVPLNASGWARSIKSHCPDVVIEAVGHQAQTVNDAVEAVAFEGTIYCFGIPAHQPYNIDVTSIVRRNLTIIGGVTTQRRQALDSACRYLAAHPDIGPSLLTHAFPCSEAQRAFETAAQPAPGRLKVIIEYPIQRQTPKDRAPDDHQ